MVRPGWSDHPRECFRDLNRHRRKISLQSSFENTPPVTQKRKRGDASRIAPWRWQKGVSPNPGGRPKHDIAKEIAVAVFENNREALYVAYTKAALKGNAYAFKELADRAFGKLKERHEIEVDRPHRNLTVDELRERITQTRERIGQMEKELELPPSGLGLPAPSKDELEKPN
jgi:hypothetical protein